MGTGIFRELWPLVLSFCGREWFEPERSSEARETEHMHIDQDYLILSDPLSLQRHGC